MVECSVCHHTFASEFALQGHIRLKKDSEHMTFKQQQVNMTSQNTILTSSSIMESSRANLIDTLEALVKNQEYVSEQKVKDNMLFMKIKNMVEQERTIEREYQRLIDEHDAKIEGERKKVREEVMMHYQEDVNNTVAKVRAEIMQNWQQAVDSSFKNGKKIGNNEGYWAAAVHLPCFFCGKEIFVKPNSGLHRFLVDFARNGWIYHPECCRVYEQQRTAYY